MKLPASTSYDLIEYPGRPYPQTHPDRLAILATVHGLEPAPPGHCRVLELGCGDGGNLVPMACALPGSEFTGVDLAATAIRKGLILAAKLGLRNLALHHGDLRELPETIGRFDYIIAHGVYSWVPAEVREALLGVCQRLLAEQGVAFVSYNAYPGGHVRMLFREMMLLHVRPFTDPGERVDQALALMRFLGEGVRPDAVYGAMVKQELERVRAHSRAHLFHDDLAEVNCPFYFSEFLAQARMRGLEYLSEADFFETQYDFYPEPVVELLDGLRIQGRLMEQEQMLDFLKCRRFRQTLLCRREIEVDRRPKPELLPRFLLAAAARPQEPVGEVHSLAEVQFDTPRGGMMRTTNPLAKAALLCLGEQWPGCLAFTELVVAIRTVLGREPDAGELCQILWRAFATGLLELHLHRPPIAREPGERPVTTELVRHQVGAGDTVTNLRHVPIQLSDTASRQLLALLDGTRDRAALLTAMADAALDSRTDASLAAFAAMAPEAQVTKLNDSLSEFARLALLIQ